MRGYTKAASAVITLGLAVSMAACSSSGSPSSPSTQAGGTTGGSAPAASTTGGTTGGTSGPVSNAQPIGAFSTLTGKGTAVALDAGFLKALTSLGVTPAPTGKAKFDAKTATIAFPITGGNAKIYAYKSNVKGGYVQGMIEHNGSGLSLSAGGTTVTLENFVINPGSNSVLTGKVLLNGKQAFPAGTPLFDLDGSTLKKPTISAAGVATLTGTTVYVSTAAAGALNMVFKLTGKKALPTTKDAIKVGIATIEATGKA